ncbi:MAG TPA: hypothetical protein O0W90_00140, partial [Methanocorpusculum sp.]|nr:hypothetical protein [Methanocorpusculum sp.]
TITIDSSITNGGVTSDKTSASFEDTITLTITPNTGYSLDTITVTDSANNPITDTSGNTFTMPASNVNVKATFNKIPSPSEGSTSAGNDDYYDDDDDDDSSSSSTTQPRL